MKVRERLVDFPNRAGAVAPARGPAAGVTDRLAKSARPEEISG
jgi:hypothetical protein